MGGRHKLFVSKRDPQSTTCTKTYEVNQRCWIKLSAVFEPDVTGDWEFGLVVAAGQGDLYIEGEKVIDNTVDQKPSDLFACAGTIEERGLFKAQAGRVYNLEVRFHNHHPVPGQVIPMGRGAIELKELRDFIKVELGAGEKKTCSVRLTLEAFAYFDTSANNWTVDAGDYKVLLGSSSRDIKESVDMCIETKASWLEYPKLK